jgi:DME family drug/metabolite transporter
MRGYTLVLLAATLWSFLGIIYKALSSFGFSATGIAALRAGLGGGLIFFGILIFRPAMLRLSWCGLGDILLYGIFGVALFYGTYIRAILTAGAAISAVLLYTAPAWVAFIAWRFLGEKLTRSHVIALALSLVGAAFIANITNFDALKIGIEGIVWGLLSGLTYGLWSVFNKIGVQRNNPWTLQVYGLLIGVLVLLPLHPLSGNKDIPLSLSMFIWLVILALGPTVGASVAYAAAMKDIPVSTASIISTIEPVFAVILAVTFLQEKLSGPQIFGCILILCSVALLRPREQASQEALG